MNDQINHPIFRGRLTLALGIISFTFVSACASPKPGPVILDSEMQVSVSTNGKPVQNFETALVHRISVPKKFASNLLVSSAKGIPLKTAPEKDQNGKITGLRIRSSQDSSVLSTLGLQPNDLITAIGQKHAEKPTDLVDLFQSLVQTKEFSITLERSGMPHKILYQAGT